MEDIAPGLLEEIRHTFVANVEDSAKIKALYQLIQGGKATYADAEEYAYLVGETLSQAFGNHLSAAVLPDGRMYYNIADRVLRPLLEEDHTMVADAAMMVQTSLNQAANIGLKAQSVAVNTDRINGIIDKVSNAENFDDVAWVLDAPVKNFSMNVVDEILKANVNFQGSVGLTPRIIRKAERKCCKWCSALAGEYEYPDVPHDVYRRHENCRCIVEYDPGDGRRQNAHTKNWTLAADSDTLEARKTIGMHTVKENQARAMANGPRRGRLTNVSEMEQQQIYTYADELKIPREILSFNTGLCTSFDDDTGLIHIRGDIFPSDFAENPDSILSAKCALAHEYYGHYLHHDKFDPGDWRDEFQASYRAALDAPDLSDNERSMLMLDAFERAQVAGVSVKLNTIARRLLYGID